MASTATVTATRDVDPGYVHYDKYLVPDENLRLNESTLKWYDLAPEDQRVPDAIRDLAIDFLKNESDTGELDQLGDLGFIILHRCGLDFYFLIVNTWRNENELWETVYAKKNDTEVEFSLFPRPGPHRAAFCVWELVAVMHEQQAWRRFLISARDEQAKIAYLEDRYRGPA